MVGVQGGVRSGTCRAGRAERDADAAENGGKAGGGVGDATGAERAVLPGDWLAGRFVPSLGQNCQDDWNVRSHFGHLGASTWRITVACACSAGR
jgi:hypothetical protein